MAKTLPDYNGAVVRMAFSFDSIQTFSVGMLGWDEPCERLLWYFAGIRETHTQGEFAAMAGDHWEELTQRPTDVTKG